MSVIDELYENRDEEELVVQLEEKYEQLREFNKIKEIRSAEHLEHILRPYQEHRLSMAELPERSRMGRYTWLMIWVWVKPYRHFLFCNIIKIQHGKLKALVVCPTTLMFNWENEIKKFTPALTYHIHHGGERTRVKEEFTNAEC